MLGKEIFRVPMQRVKARVALSNDAGRCESHQRITVDGGWAREDELSLLRTEVRLERARSAITCNRSPDLPFNRSINP